MSRRVLLPLMACVAALTACTSSHKPADTSPEPFEHKTVVNVDNRNFLDMTIYVLNGAQRVRLGIANGKSVTLLTIPSYLVRGTAPLRFLCDPIGSTQTPVSDEIAVQPGDEVTLTIPE